MMRRPGGAEFAPDAYVYPGGSVHSEDSRFGDSMRGAAARELFEEMGLLLARGRRGFATDRDCERVSALTAAGRTFADALVEARLEPALDRLVYLTRWITPLQLRRRFDTRFYLARRPAGQTERPHPGEVVDWRWVEPLDALEGGDLQMVHATRRILESVASEADISRFIARVRRRRGVPPPVQPVLRRTEIGWEVSDGLTMPQRQRDRQRA